MVPDFIVYTTEQGGRFKVLSKPKAGEYERIVESGRVVFQGDRRPTEPPRVDEEFYYVVALQKTADFDKGLGGPR